MQLNTLIVLNSCPNKIEFHLRLLDFLNSVYTLIILLSSKQLGFVSKEISITVFYAYMHIQKPVYFFLSGPF